MTFWLKSEWDDFILVVLAIASDTFINFKRMQLCGGKTGHSCKWDLVSQWGLTV